AQTKGAQSASSKRLRFLMRSDLLLNTSDKPRKQTGIIHGTIEKPKPPEKHNFSIAGELGLICSIPISHRENQRAMSLEVTQKSAGRPPAVHAERLAGDVTAFRGGEE